MRTPDKSVRLFYAPQARREKSDAGEVRDRRVVLLSPDESRHAADVLRLGAGDAVRLFDGEGFFYEGRIVEVGRRGVGVEVLRSAPSAAEARVRVILLVASLKGRKSDWIVEKSVELGVGEVVFFPCDRSVGRWDGAEAARAHEERWARIAISACKQCGGARLMPARARASLEEALSAAPADAVRYAFWEGESVEPRGGEEPGWTADVVCATPPADSPEGAPGEAAAAVVLCALIGPEGGLTAREIERIRGAGFQTRSLGPRILRAETAALAAAAILLHGAGDLGPALSARPWEPVGEPVKPRR